jgi:hypothetical protein
MSRKKLGPIFIRLQILIFKTQLSVLFAIPWSKFWVFIYSK